MERIRRRLYDALESIGREESSALRFGFFLALLIILNVFAVVLESVPVLAETFGPIFVGFEIFSIGVFTVEYVLRLWACTADPRYRHPILGRLRFMVTPMAIIDLFAFLPFYLPFFGADLRMLRALRLFRLMRLFKLARYSDALTDFSEVLKKKKEALILTSGAAVLLLLLISSLMHLVEGAAQPEAFGTIPDALWWAIITLTTVGYGDTYPVTTGGKVLASIVAFLGVGMIAIPASLLASGFSDQIRARRDPIICPHCGNEIAADGIRSD